MPTASETKRYRNQFLGYGNPSSPCWVIGIEEGGAEQEQKEKAWHRLGCHQLLDIFELHKEIDNLKWFGERARTQPTYGKLCRFFLAYVGQLEEGASLRNKREATRCFQAECLGRTKGQCVVLEVRGGVSKKISNQSASQDRNNPCCAAIRKLVEDHRPKVMLCYGKACWKEFKSLFDDVEWTPRNVDGLTSKADFKTGMYNGTLVILSHHAVRTSNCYFEELGRWAASQTP